MGYRIDWAKSALADLQDIVRYIALDDPAAAFRYGGRIIAKIESVATFPRSGKIVREFGEDTIRELVLPPCRIIYELNDSLQLLTVLRVWHGARGDVII